MTQPSPSFNLLSLIASANAEGVFFDLRQNSRGWDVHARRKLTEQFDSLGACVHRQFAIGFSVNPDIYAAINEAYLRCIAEFDRETWEPTWNAAATEPSPDLLTILNIPRRPVVVGPIRRS